MRKNNKIIVIGMIIFLAIGLYFVTTSFKIKPIGFYVLNPDIKTADQCKDTCSGDVRLYGCFWETDITGGTCQCFDGNCAIEGMSCSVSGGSPSCVGTPTTQTNGIVLGDTLFNVRLVDVPASVTPGTMQTFTVRITNIGKKGTMNVDLGVYLQSDINKWSGEQVFSVSPSVIVNKENCVEGEPNVARKEITLDYGVTEIVEFNVQIPTTEGKYGISTGSFDKCYKDGGLGYASFDYKALTIDNGTGGVTLPNIDTIYYIIGGFGVMMVLMLILMFKRPNVGRV